MKCATALFFVAAAGLHAQEIRLVQVASGISAPTDIQNAADGSNRLFLVQQNGIIKILRNGTILATPFLNITSKTRADGERGLLGLAFPHGFAQSGRFYVDYTDLNGDTNIAQYHITSNPDVADASSEIVLLHIPQPFSNHNGGQVRFGPDGYLYIAMGDGGSGGDPMRNGQNLGSLLGKLLRIDVESQPGQVRIPASNPFLSTSGARGEVWAYGLRNPWRFTFDRATNDLWTGDVGQDLYEEIDLQPAGQGGLNYGWNIMEGLHCYSASNCNQQGKTLPVAEYPHAEGCSVIGGFMYRGAVSPGLRGTYIFADLCSGVIWGLQHDSTGWSRRTLVSSGFGVTTFGEDEAGEVYVSNANNGSIWRINGSAAPRILSGGVTNAASFQAGIVPGSLVTAFAYGVLDTPGAAVADKVPLPTALNAISVTVNGTPAPVYSLANAAGLELVSFQAPFELAGQGTASIVISRSGSASAPLDVPVLALQPGVYTSDGVQAIAVHAADYSLVTASKPLRRGEDAFVYASGLGPVTNQPKTGDGGPISPVAAVTNTPTVTLGGAQATNVFAGLAPGFTGVYQVNFRVPDAGPTGSIDLVLSINRAAAPPVKATVQ